MSSKYAVYISNVITLMVLARYFTPDVFGLVAMVNVFYIFFQFLSEGGVGPAIINCNKLTKNERDGIFSITLIMGCVLSLILYFSSSLISILYNNEEIKDLIPFVVVSTFFFSITVLPNVFLLREQRYYVIAFSNILSELTGLALTLILINFFEPKYALVSRLVCIPIVNFICIYFSSRKTEFGRPNVGYNLLAIKPFLSFSIFQYGYNIVNFFTRNIDSIIVARVLGITSIGLYDRAYQLMRYPLMLLTFAMTPAIQPTLRDKINDIEAVESLHFKFTLQLTALGIAASIFVFFSAQYIVYYVLGEQWLDVIPLIKILSLAIPIQCVLSTSASFYQAFSKVTLLFANGLFTSFLMIFSAALIMEFKSITLMCWLVVAVYHISFIQCYYLMYKYIFKKSSIKYIVSILSPILVILLFVYYMSDAA